jgi:hypothetical protein
MKTLIIADAHGNFDGINNYCKNNNILCSNIILLGDQEPKRDIKKELSNFKEIYFVFGNHDETEQIYNNHKSIIQNNLHGTPRIPPPLAVVRDKGYAWILKMGGGNPPPACLLPNTTHLSVVKFASTKLSSGFICNTH